MALVTPTKVGNPEGNVVCWKYANIDENSTFNPVPVASRADVSMHGYGTFGGATVGVEGSNVADKDKTTLVDADYEPLVRADGSTVVGGSSDFLHEILQNTYWIRPTISGGSGTSLTVYLLVKGQ